MCTYVGSLLVIYLTSLVDQLCVSVSTVVEVEALSKILINSFVDLKQFI